jgi:YHS domain-containing protein
MLRLVLFLALSIFVGRAFWRVVDGFMEGVSGRSRRTQAPQRRVQMARDPVCGTFVVPDAAVSLVEGRTRLFFCSDACRDTYRARTA